MHRLVFSGVIVSALLLAAPGSAQSVDDEVRCLILGAAFQGSAKEPAAKQAASAATLYFLGRVSARVPPGELKSTYLAQATRLKAESAGPMMDACFKQMQAQVRAVDAVRQEIGRSLAKQPAPTKK
jgi:hypothetical protein